MLFVGLGSIGNGIESRRVLLPLFGILVMAFFAWLLQFGVQLGDSQAAYVAILGMISLAIVILFQIANLLVICFKPSTVNNSAILKRLLRTATLSDFKDLKVGGQRKINAMLENALNLNSQNERQGVLTTHFGKGLHNFAAISDKTEVVGGFTWAWKNIWNSDAYTKHAIWYYDRLVAINITQFLLSIFVLLLGIGITRNLKWTFDAEVAKASITDITEVVLDTTVTDETVEAFLSVFNVLVGGFLGNTSVIDCSAYQSYSDSVIAYGTEFLAHSNVSTVGGAASTLDFICTYVELSQNSTLAGAAGIAAQLELLKEAGFDVDSLREQIFVTATDATDTAVDSLHPAEEYM